ncbi:hypothetical protein ILUMI_22180 [Ignelater luminosus]|uniref:Male-enhanced antigen 1 n=1 Tax=Ignelater luminosus TaxID=2038154 RepID=A0A8K0CEV7_IGNLU|nr:hypothetical protein ILUMI_22180 [Ignelater luminosus]
MGCNNKGVPQPPNNSTEENLSPNEDVVLGTDSDSDEDDNALSGYEPLPLAPPEDLNNDESSDSEDDSGVGSGGQPSEESLPPINRIENQLVGEVWSGPSPSAVDIKMDSNKVDEVKQVMANITLPPSSIPEWANNIPEEQWKQHLLSRLHDLQRFPK